MQWPAGWIITTFTSPAKTEELLRPELEDNLSYADFQKALDFFPGSHRRLRVRV